MRPSPLLAVVAALGCAAHRASLRQGPAGERRAIVRAARSLLGAREITLRGRRLPSDCWALPVAAYGRSGLALGGGNAEGLYADARAAGRLREAGRPRPGDLLFLRIPPQAPVAGAPVVHVGIVGEVALDGTLLVYQRMAHGVVAYHLNPGHPKEPFAPEGRAWNDPIATGPGVRRPAGELYAGYASLVE